MSTAQVIRGVYGRYDFFLRRRRQGALANTKSHQTKFRDNGVGALLLLFFKRFSAVSQTKFFGIFFEIFKLVKKKYNKNTTVSHTLAVIRVYKLKNENTSKMHM